MPDASDSYRRYLNTVDPPADAVAAAFAELPAGRGRQMLERALADGIVAVPAPPPALVDLFAQVDAPPVWVDWERVDRGGGLFLRSGLLGMLVLNLACLPTMYASPGGNKPLVFTGHLLQRAPRRLAETARFMLETSRAGGLRRSAEGFKTSIRVRLMHAQVRRLLWRSGRWNSAWGEPVNQMYMAGTNIALSVVFLDGLRRFGLRVSRNEAEALLAMWRYSSHLMGVLPELQCSTEAEGWHIERVIRRCEGPPDDDSRALIAAAIHSSYVPQLDRYKQCIPMAYDLSRVLVGHAVADGMGYPPRSGWGWLRVAGWPAVAATEVAQRLWPGGRSRAARLGEGVWDAVITEIMAGKRSASRDPTVLNAAPNNAPPGARP